MINQNTINAVIIAGAVGIVVAINLVILGLIAIAVVHDGTTAANVASTFEQVLIDAITAISTLFGGLVTGKIVHTAMLAKAGANV